VRWDRVYGEARAIIDELGVKLDPRTPVYQLGIADRQLIEIAKAISSRARVLILDEPTAVLSSREIDALFEILRRLRERGVALMLISHKLDEIRDITDRVVVLRDGERVAERRTADVTVPELIHLMVGREISDLFPAVESHPGEVRLRVEGLTRRGYFEDVSFSVRAGEILGFAGLVGAGRTEVAQTLFGIDSADAGEITLDGLRFAPQSPRHAIRCGLAYLPENRLTHGLVPKMRVPLNMTMSIWSRLATWFGFFRTREMLRRTDELARRVELQAGRVNQMASTLSGGNQQKLLLARWAVADVALLLVDEPTRGVDIGAKVSILETLRSLAERGLAVIVVSSELEDLEEVCDRVLVMRHGRMVGTLVRGSDELSVDAMLGLSFQ
jgi:ABC-type sugar transport system ATPase subunit